MTYAARMGFRYSEAQIVRDGVPRVGSVTVEGMVAYVQPHEQPVGNEPSTGRPAGPMETYQVRAVIAEGRNTWTLDVIDGSPITVQKRGCNCGGL